MGLLKERQQTEKLQLFERFQAVLLGMACIAGLNVAFQSFDTMNRMSSRWYYQWFPNVAVSHIIFFIILIAFVILWAPHEGSDVYAYGEQIQMEEDENDAENADVDDDDTAPKKTRVTPEPIGVSM